MGETSCDGFGQQNLEELECKNMYHQFEGSMQSQDSFDQESKSDKGSSIRQPSFRNLLNNIDKR